jgi:hypothetical protein
LLLETFWVELVPAAPLLPVTLVFVDPLSGVEPVELIFMREAP